MTLTSNQVALLIRAEDGLADVLRCLYQAKIGSTAAERMIQELANCKQGMSLLNRAK